MNIIIQGKGNEWEEHSRQEDQTLCQGLEGRRSLEMETGRSSVRLKRGKAPEGTSDSEGRSQRASPATKRSFMSSQGQWKPWSRGVIWTDSHFRKVILTEVYRVDWKRPRLDEEGPVKRVWCGNKEARGVVMAWTRAKVVKYYWEKCSSIELVYLRLSSTKKKLRLKNKLYMYICKHM